MTACIIALLLIAANLLNAQQTIILTPKHCKESAGYFRNWNFELTHPGGKKEKIKVDFGEKFMSTLNQGKYEIGYETIYDIQLTKLIQ